MRTTNSTLSNKFESESIGKLLWSYSIPAIIGTMSYAIYNVVDRIFIGQGVGPLAISGLALTLPIMTLFAAFGMLIGAGSAARISICLGEKNLIKAEKILGNAFILTIIISGIVYSLNYIFIREILIAFGGTENIMPYAMDYMKVIIPGQIFSTIAFGFNNIMRASGYPQKAMITMLSGAIINTILDPIFIYGFDLGIKGAAYATVISMFINSIWVLSHFIDSKNHLYFKKEHFKLNKEIIVSIISIGLSPFLMQVTASFINVIMNNILKNYGGDLAIGAYGIINSIMILLVLSIIGINQGMQPIVGYSYGAKLYERMFKTLKYAAVSASIITTIGFILAFFFPSSIASIFTNDKELLAISENGLKLSLSMFFIVGFQIVIVNFFQSIGKAKASILLSLTRQVIFIIPGLIILPRFFNLDGVWLAMPIADTLSAIVATTTLIWLMRKIKQE